MCNKAVDIFGHVLEFVSDCYKTQKMRNKAVDTSSSAKQFVSDQYKTRKMCDKAVDAFLSILKFVLDWFVTNKMLKKLYDVIFSNDDMSLLMKILIMLHFSDDIDLHTIDLNNINLDDDKFD